ncbi:MAG: D-alanine--D-alanine ligase [Weeksellaceae bacterium]
MVKHEIKKITHYEFWEYWVFYAPMLIIWFYYSLKARSFTYFTAVNPGLKHGGFFDYSKYDIQKQLPSQLRPKEQLVRKLDEINKDFNFPFIAKPEIGERGKRVQLISSQKELDIYERNAKGNPFIIQEYVDLPKEYGIFYAKLPEDKIGKVLSITGKEFLTFTGDGQTSLREFIESDSRAYFNKSYLYMKYHKEQNLVLPPGEKLILEYIGNHNRGTYFYDHSEIITTKLEKAIDEAVSHIKGFNYGRLDVKSTSDEALQNGEFTIIEVNGANSEPTHIYDENYTIVQAYKEVMRHLKVEYIIAKDQINKGVKPTPLIEFIKALYQKLLG